MRQLQDFSAPPAEHPKLAAITAQLRERQEAQETREREVKTELVQKAANFLEDFYKVRISDALIRLLWLAAQSLRDS